MNILVIGNGFDLAHGLPTSYKDFLVFIERYKEYYDKSRIIYDFTNITMYFRNLKERWIHHFLKLKDENMLESKQTWIDFESEISKVIQTLDIVKRRLKNDFYSETNQVRLDEYEFEVLYDIFEFYTK